MTYTIKRSNRKTCAIHLAESSIEVRAPLRMPEADIRSFVESKSELINARLAKLSAHASKRADFTLTYGDTVRYRGGSLTIVAKPGDRVGMSADSFYMPSNLAPEKVKYACSLIYRLCAKQVLADKAATFALKMGVYPTAVKINGAKHRWGSCSSKRSLNFSWMLMMADEAVIDYVVVHELAHLKELNHSVRFWAHVEKAMPDYKQRESQLKALQEQLRDEDWNV